FFIKSEHVEAILRDNGYEPATEPQASDLAVYRRSDGQIVHSGIVRVNTLGQMRVESKWGAFGVFLHPADAHPYRHATCTFYRAARADHLLQCFRDVPGNARGEDIVE